MPDTPAILPLAYIQHGAAGLASLKVDCYGAELRDGDGFVGDRASKRAFHAILDHWRDRLRQVGEDPLGEKPSEEIGKKRLDKLLTEGSGETAALILSAVEEFAQELAAVIRRFLELPHWAGTQRIAIGGGLRASRIGELAIGRAAVLLKAEGRQNLELRPIRHHPDEAGLIGSLHLTPAWALAGYDGMLAVDIGGTNIRAGVVELNLQEGGGHVRRPCRRARTLAPCRRRAGTRPGGRTAGGDAALARAPGQEGRAAAFPDHRGGLPRRDPR